MLSNLLENVKSPSFKLFWCNNMWTLRMKGLKNTCKVFQLVVKVSSAFK